jgi:hypothetical protein
MSLLRSFSCAYCNWAGSAVSSSSLNAYAQLQYLDIRGNRFTAPLAWLGSFTTSTVRFLYVSTVVHPDAFLFVPVVTASSTPAPYTRTKLTCCVPLMFGAATRKRWPSSSLLPFTTSVWPRAGVGYEPDVASWHAAWVECDLALGQQHAGAGPAGQPSGSTDAGGVQ